MKSVIVIDDHPIIAMAVKGYFEREGDFVIVGDASSGSAGLELVRRLTPDLVILDLLLSRVDGLTLIRQLRAIDPAPKILILSARDEAIYISRAAEEGANGFVAKSASLDILLQAARTVLAGFHLFPESAATRSRERPGGIGPTELSKRELAVLSHIAHGYRNKDIAGRLFLSPKTVSTYKTRLMNKLGLESVLDLVDYARSHGIG